MSKWYKDFNSRTISVTNHNIYFVKKKKKNKLNLTNFNMILLHKYNLVQNQSSFTNIIYILYIFERLYYNIMCKKKKIGFLAMILE